MYNYSNLCDYEFEILCKDIMQKKLGKPLQIFARGRDGGIDITDDTVKKNVVIQVKHYIKSKYADLLSSLKKEVAKVVELAPDEYYVCCAVELTAANKTEIYGMFSEYMEDSGNILSLNDIDEFLQDPENEDIVRKHYKLWLESTGVLGDIYNRDIFIDCETLLYDIENEQKEFVETTAYRQCIDILEQDRLLMILGMPGTGKTLTTKMLALYYAASGYRIVYTTNGDLQSIKKALSTDKDSKEIILLDDCLGQYYFRMKDTQENELMSLVKYILMHKNKKLIMNSRVTIFQQAKETYIDLHSFIELEKIKLQFIDMSMMIVEDKGRIFKNHLYFRNIPSDYYAQIVKDHNYRKIVNHRNYTPRIVDYVTRVQNYKRVGNSEYCDFIMRCLDTPMEIWNDEFNNRLQPEDRIFLTSLFSLTDVSVEEDVLHRVFNARIASLSSIDTTKNVWFGVLTRMEGTFVKIIAHNGVREIGVLNPSVNDFLKHHLDGNELEVNEIKKKSTEYRQIVRGFGPDMKDVMLAGNALSYNYGDDREKYAVILTYICELGICNDAYRDIVGEFVCKLPFFYYEKKINTFTILPMLFREPIAGYYDSYELLSAETFARLLMKMDFDDFCILQDGLNENRINLHSKMNIDFFVSQLDRAIRGYIDECDREEYYMEYDMYELFNDNMIFNGEYQEVDVDKVVKIVTERVQEDIYEYIMDKLSVFPRSISDKIDISSYDVWVDSSEIDQYVDETLADPGDRDIYDYYDDVESYSGRLSGMDELDLIFAE